MERYEKYKESGVAWIGEIPEHWGIKKLKYLLTEKLKYGANEPAEQENPNEPRYIRITDFGDDGKLKEDTFKSLPFDVAKEYLLKVGDVLFARSGATVGKTFQFKNYEGIACFAGYLIKASPNESIMLSDFLYLYTKSGAYDNWKNSIFNQATIQNIGADKYCLLEIPVPQITEQIAICNLLHKINAEIDKLVVNKQRLIELLKEERTAIINTAVTKGSDPNVKLRSSGIEWVGDIPAHWEVKKFGREVYIQEGPGIMASDFRTEGIPLIRIAGLKSGYASFDGCNYLDSEKVENKWSHFRLDLGDVLISCSASTELVSEVGKEVVGSIAYTGIVRLKPNENIDKNYLKLFVSSYSFQQQVDILKAGSTIQHYGPTHLKRFFFILPPKSEQQSIVAKVDNQIKHIDITILNIEKEIELLQEYRTALISEAVTGKVKVG